jgi:hypothetical protein
MKRLLAALVAFLTVACLPAWADDVGFFIRSDPALIDNPVALRTVLFDSTDGVFKVWTGLAWRVISPPVSNFLAVTAPTVSDDSGDGYSSGSIWVNTLTGATYVCSNATLGAAVWNLQNASLAPKLTTGDWLPDWKVTGLAGSVPGSGLSANTSLGVAYVDGLRVAIGLTTYAYTASKDTYDFLQSDGTWHHNAVNNGAGQPTDTGLLIQKVVSNATDVTAITPLAATAPKISVTAATSGGQAINLTQANSLYLPYTLFAADGDLLVGDGTPGGVTTMSPGANGTLLGVPPVGVGLQYNSLAAGGQVSINHVGTVITITDGLPAPSVANNAMVANGSAWLSAAIVNSVTATYPLVVSTPTGTPALSMTQFASSDQTITSAGTLTVAHSLGTTPKRVWAALVCQIAEAGYSPADVVFCEQGPSGTDTGYAITVDATNLNVIFGSAASPFSLPDKATGVGTALTNANWKVRFYAQ